MRRAAAVRKGLGALTAHAGRSEKRTKLTGLRPLVDLWGPRELRQSPTRKLGAGAWRICLKWLTSCWLS